MHLHIESAGEGPAVLFIHAGVADSRMWADQLREFSSTHHVISYDQRGFGKTPWEPGPYSEREDALAVLDQVGADSAVVVGCSMGAGTALQLAIDHPDRVEGLVLVGAFPSGWVPEDGWEESPLEEEAERAAEEGDLERVVEIDLAMWLVGYGRSGDELDPVLKELFTDMDRVPVSTEAERNEHRIGYDKTLNEHLDQIGVPTLVVVGAHDEPLLIKAARYLAERLGGRSAVVIDGTAHLPSLERPHAFNEVLGEFLGAT